MKYLMLAALAGTAVLAVPGTGSSAQPAGARSDASGVRCTWTWVRQCPSGRFGRCTYRRVPVSCTGLPDMGNR